MFRGVTAIALVLAVAGCPTKPNPVYCDDDTPCTRLDAPYCDLAGDFGPRNTCIAFPVDAGVSDASTAVDAASIPDAAMTLPDAAAAIDAAPRPDAMPAGALEVAAGGSHTCVLLAGGDVRCWGRGLYGQTGHGTTDDIGDDETALAAAVVDVGGPVTKLALGFEHTCALLTTGNVRCWGRADRGQLGYGTTDDIGDDEAPASAGDVAVGAAVQDIVAGSFHTCVLLTTGNVRCWGRNAYGELGYGHTQTIGDDESPSVAGNVDVGGTVVALSAGELHTCALLDTGSVRCWGFGFYGRLGYGNQNAIGDTESPATAGDVNVGSSVTQVVTGQDHTCALLSTGGVKCWGTGSFGRLGYANTDNIGDDETPFTVGEVMIGGTVIELAAGGQHTCARLATSAVVCWGQGLSGRLGYGNEDRIGDDEAPFFAGAVSIGGGVAVQLSAGATHTCARLMSGNIRCWGSGSFGRLGYGNIDDIGDDETPSSAGNVPAF